MFIERPKNPRLVASKIVKVEHALFMSACYEEKHGRPHTLDGLNQHQFVDYAPYRGCADLSWWNKQVLPARRIPLKVDSASVYLAAIRSGMGIGLLPNFYKRAAPDLIALPLPTECYLNLWLVSASHCQQVAPHEGAAAIPCANDLTGIARVGSVRDSGRSEGRPRPNL